ncbi:MAG: hypothetical protein SGARI_004273 [Bacillariaceae sp.]
MEESQGSSTILPNITGANDNGGGTTTNGRPFKKKLTKEQVMELPEISYEGTNEDDSENELVEDHAKDVTVKMGSDDDSDDVDVVGVSVSKEATHPILEGDEKRFTNTISTTCAICIDSFEHGENIRLLPRCGHAYHTECILPWLTTREACCPFCKTMVLKSHDISDDGAVDETQELSGEIEPPSEEQAPQSTGPQSATREDEA